MSNVLQAWRVIFDQIKELELTILLNNITDGAITTRIKEISKLSNFIQVKFDDQYQRRNTSKIRITSLMNTRIREIGVVLANLLGFVPYSAAKFQKEIKQVQRNIDILLSADLDENGRSGSRCASVRQKSRPLFNNYSVRNEFSAYDREDFDYQYTEKLNELKQSKTDIDDQINRMRPFSTSRPKSASKKSQKPFQYAVIPSTVKTVKNALRESKNNNQLNNLNATIQELEQQHVKTQQFDNDCKIKQLQQKINTIKNTYVEDKNALTEQNEQLQHDLAYLTDKYDFEVQNNKKYQRTGDQLMAQNNELRDTVTLLQNEITLLKNKLNNADLVLQTTKRDHQCEVKQLNNKIEEIQKQFEQNVREQFQKAVELKYEGSDNTIEQECDRLKQHILQMSQFNNFDLLDQIMQTFAQNIANNLQNQKEASGIDYTQMQRQCQQLQNQIRERDEELRFLKNSLRLASSQQQQLQK